MSKQLPEIAIARAYDLEAQDRGFRVLVDRLWPRGLKKEDLQLDEWAKDVAPSTPLRKWFGHRRERWTEFKKRYRQELGSRSELVDKLLRTAARRRVVLVYGARDPVHNHAVVLQELLQSQRAAADPAG